MKEPRVVIDSNVLVSILKGSPRLSSIYSAFKEERFRLIINAEILRELSAVLYRPQLRIDPDDIKELFRIIRMKAIRIKSPKSFINACRDAKDNFILELAIAAKANIIVTGDEDLLCLTPFRGISIVSPKEFILLLNKP